MRGSKYGKRPQREENWKTGRWRKRAGSAFRPGHMHSEQSLVRAARESRKDLRLRPPAGRALALNALADCDKSRQIRMQIAPRFVNRACGVAHRDEREVEWSKEDDGRLCRERELRHAPRVNHALQTQVRLFLLAVPAAALRKPL
eukprot:4273333-Pleurochrysis_carterae.AAC.1